MQKRVFALIIAFLLTKAAFAAGDITITSLTADKTTVEAGGDVTLVVGVRNHGPDSANAVRLFFGTDHAEAIHGLSAVAAPGWECSLAITQCSTESMASQAEATLTYRLLVPATLQPATFKLIAALLSSPPDEGPNRADVPITVVAANRNVDLSLSLSAPPNPIRENTPVTLAYDVRNNGPQDLRDVRVLLSMSKPAGLTPVYEGAGWSCTTNDTLRATCRRDSLAANANAPLAVRFTSPASSFTASTSATAYSAQAHLDPDLSNNNVSRSLSIGNATDWTLILAPFTASEIPGANGSRWKTEINAVIESDVRPDLVERPCGPVEDPCGTFPLNRLFNASLELLFGADGPQFVYIRREDASKLTLATQVRDLSQHQLTAGAFVPMPRDRDFSSEGFSLISIPVVPDAFRSTLRIYDATGIDPREVEISLYGDAESEPFLRQTVTLRTIAEQVYVTTAMVPRYPAFAQIDLMSLVPSSYGTVRVAVRPLPSESGMKLWGFASITNNTTSHVSVVVP